MLSFLVHKIFTFYTKGALKSTCSAVQPVKHRDDIPLLKLRFLQELPSCEVVWIHRGADKSLARLGRKPATATKLWLLIATQKKKKIRKLSVQPDLRGNSSLRVGRKMAPFQLFFQSCRAKDLPTPLYRVQWLQWRSPWLTVWFHRNTHVLNQFINRKHLS